MTRLERMTREALQWAPIWGAAWALNYIRVALVADALERRDR